MGMTIEESIYYLEVECLGISKNNKHYIANKKAIDTMRKYQKIEQIVSDFREYLKGISCGFGGEVYMEMVSKVVEDGNDTTNTGSN